MNSLVKMLTKTQLKIMQIFTSSIIKSFNPTDISKTTGLDYRHAYMTIKSLVAEKLLNTEHNLYKLNYKDNHQKLSYVEHLRSEEFLKKKKNRFIKLFVKDTLKKIKEDCFILIIFGSTVSESKPRDTDILVIVDSQEKVEPTERTLHNLGELTTLKLDIQVLSHESVYEMLEKRDQNNLINMILNKHLVIYGAEIFYRLLAKGRR